MAKKRERRQRARVQASPGQSVRYVRYCLLFLLIGAVALVWLSLVTFNPADPPSNVSVGRTQVSNAAGIVGAHIAYVLRFYLGCGVYMGVLFVSIAAFMAMLGARVKDLSWRAIGVALLVTSTSTAAFLLNPSASVDLAQNYCGILGKNAGELLREKFQPAGGWLVVLVTLSIGLMLTADSLMLQLPGWFRRLWIRTAERIPSAIAALRPASPSNVATEGPAVISAPRPAATVPAALTMVKPSSEKFAKPGKPGKGILPDLKELRERATATPPPPVRPVYSQPATDFDDIDDVEDKPAAISPAKPASTQGVYAPADPLRPQSLAADGTSAQAARPQPQVSAIAQSPTAPVQPATKPEPPKPMPAEKDDKQSAPVNGALAAAISGESSAQAVKFVIPSTSLLADPTGGYIQSQEAQAGQKRAILQQTLNDFGVSAEVVGHMTGPVITLFELSMAPGVKVAQVANLSTDIARALAVPGVRVVSPIPGKDTVGIEVPNLEKEIVRIKELMNMQPDSVRKMHLPLYLGKDAGGGGIIADLSRMPHMLIAGTTGSGKSVCINTIIMSLLLTRTPDEVRFILVDPKMVEMAAFETIPHLLCPVVNDMRRAEDILEWAATKMDERYELLKEAGVKNIAGYNSLPKDELYRRFKVESDDEKAAIPTRMPYYVIIIDELADLIMTSTKEVEGHIIRIAQKARAVGIHLILATQRPSVNVVTGLIKSNMPCRVSFRVASRQESRIVLDQNGADVLMGQGDMLFLQPGTSNLMRAQGTYVDDSEIRHVVDAIKKVGGPEFNPELMRIGSANVDGEGAGERDEMFDKAVEIVLQSQRGSVSLLQRRLSVGYSRASRIIDQMAEAGILGDYKGSQARECNMTLDDWYALKGSIQADQSGEASLDGEPTSS